MISSHPSLLTQNTTINKWECIDSETRSPCAWAGASYEQGAFRKMLGDPFIQMHVKQTSHLTLNNLCNRTTPTAETAVCHFSYHFKKMIPFYMAFQGSLHVSQATPPQGHRSRCPLCPHQPPGVKLNLE